MKRLSILACILFGLGHIAFGQDEDSDPQLDSAKNSKKYKPKISGFIQTQFLHPVESNGDEQTKPDRFRIQRVRIKVTGKINKDVSYQVEVDPRAPEVTGLLRDAYIALEYIPKHEIRIGQQKTQFGYENVVSSSRLYFVNRTDVSDNLGRGNNLRDIGVGLIGKIKINDHLRFEDAITLVNGAGMNVQADNNKKKNIWGRAGLRYKNNSLMTRVGVSGARGDVLEIGADTLSIDIDRLGFDFQFEHKWFTAAAEYIKGTDNIPDEVAARSGYYFLFTGRTPWQIGPAFRYENVDDGEFRRLVIGAYYGEPASRIRLLANYEIRKTEADPDLPLGEDNRFYLWLMVRF